MSSPLFSTREFERHACRTMLDAGRALHRSGTSLKKLRIVGDDIIAAFKGPPGCVAVITKKNGPDPLQFTCSCGYTYGGACEHVVAAMLAANGEQAIQTGLDFDTAGPITAPEKAGTNGPWSAENLNVSETEAQTGIETVVGEPVPRLYLNRSENMLVVELRFSYLEGKIEVAGNDRAREKLVTGPDGKIARLGRPLGRELLFKNRLTDTGLTSFRSGSFTPANDPVDWVRDHLQALAEDGFEVFSSGSIAAFRPLTSKPRLTLGVSAAGGGCIDCTVDIQYEGNRHAPLSAVYDALLANRKYVRLSDGATGEIPEEWIDKLSALFSFLDEKPERDSFRLRETAASSLRLLESIADDAAWQGVRSLGLAALDNYKKPVPQKMPAGFRGTLRSYQRAGYDWFHFLREFNLGGCLADDMGLGKTVMTLALLASEKERNVSPRPSLLVVPTTLLFNWQREIRTFASGLLVMNYHGAQRKRYGKSDMLLADVVLTTYGMVQREIDLFKNTPFNYIILDEAQNIKNPLSESAKSVRQLQSRFRLALSGTPIENGLSELWSLMTFLNPGMLGTFSKFSTGFIMPIEKEKREAPADLLRGIIAPCILRRTKEQVAKELPPKTEIIMKIPMTPRQRTLYDLAKEACRAGVMKAIDDEGMDRARIHILQALTRLRQICCHPRLIDESYTEDGCKFAAFDEFLENILAENHKALVFSQWTSLLDLLRTGLDKKAVRYEYLTGQTADRGKPVDNFQENRDIPLMLVSLKAGGVGLNLTSADYVIMFDPWWNPATEAQAADRAHRIGQTRPVFVYKMIVEDSVEEKVLELQKSKKELFEAIIKSEGPVFRDLGREEIERLFQ